MAIIIPLSLALYFLSCFPFIIVNSLSTIAISETTITTTTTTTSNHTLILICALVPSSYQKQQSRLNCTSFSQEEGHSIQIPPVRNNVSLSGIVGGNGFQCELRSVSSSISVMGCHRFSANMTYKQIYSGPTLIELHASNSQICGLQQLNNNRLECWQWREFRSTTMNNNNYKFSSIAVGENFVCGLSQEFGNIRCIGAIHDEPNGNYSVISAGFRHACAISYNGSLNCWGEGEIVGGEKPDGIFKSLALGENRSCALRQNQTVVCWGETDFTMPNALQSINFISIEAKRKVFCGIVSSNYSLYCWGNEILESIHYLVFEDVVPGPCTKECVCSRPLPNYSAFCSGKLVICEPCDLIQPCGSGPPPPPPPQSPPPTNGWSTQNVVLLVVGCVGSLSLFVVSIFLFFKYCKVRGCRVHDSGRLDEAEQGGHTSQAQPRLPLPPPPPPPPPPVLEKRLSQLASMGNNGGHLEEFSLQVLLRVTSNFSEVHRIGNGSFGCVYRATLDDGREVAIKRAEMSTSSSYTKRQEDKDNAFVNELESLSRINHKNLVRLLGFCDENNERVLVYENMDNGSLHDHLHQLKSSPLMSWAPRIKVALDAARGIEYLHVYAVPSIIHRDIKSSNILLDSTWTAKVSDFGLSLMGPEDDKSHLSLLAAGTVGYMDPEYYRLHLLTTKSDVYSFGVVLLELLSGYKAIHKNENGVPRNVVDFVVPYIVQDEIHRVLDPNVPPPTPFEIEAVAYIGYIAADCVTQAGRDRPTMTEIVHSLERALAACLAHPSLSRSTTGGSSM